MPGAQINDVRFAESKWCLQSIMSQLERYNSGPEILAEYEGTLLSRICPRKNGSMESTNVLSRKPPRSATLSGSIS